MTRSENMSRIRSKNTTPERLIRSGLHQKGFRYRLHQNSLPGSPDLVFPKYNAVIFVNGCFWHGHECSQFKWPKTNKKFWQDKIGANIDRDYRNVKELRAMNWRILTIWECSLRGSNRILLGDLLLQVEMWLKTGAEHGEFSERKK